jgi:site-specific DNA-methyltransferase (adenine-specific)
VEEKESGSEENYTAKIELIQGDCSRKMESIPARSVDMILCDLPYGSTGCKWDVVIPFDILWERYLRIIKDDGAIVLTASQPFTSLLIASNISMFRYRWIWEKEQGGNFQLAKLQPLNTVEDVCVFSKARTANGAKQNMRYYPIMTPNLKPTKSGGNPSVSDLLHKNSMVALKRTYTESYPKSVLRFNKEHSSVRLHPTQKPVALFEYLIKTYTKKGDMVLDNCMGSGTTGVACKNLNRNFTGIEIDPAFFKIACERVQEAVNLL